ncbi:MAG: LCP family protein, partial [Propionibacteriaceae bacterium]|nr:LCP family protein [Propionibacteriaceae bacterium]
FLVSLYANTITLNVLSWGIAILGAGWAFLAFDAWRIANPAVMSGVGRIVSGVITFAVVFALCFGAFNGRTIFAAQAGLVDTVFTGEKKAEVVDGRYNILLLGSDSATDRDGARMDTIMVASLDAATGRTILFGLPRNMQRVPFPKTSPLNSKYPNGYWCQSQECMLNAVYTEAESNAKLFAGVKNPGIEATRGAVSEVLGLEIHYWAIVDMAGFEKLIDAVGGIRLDIGKRIPMGSEKGRRGVFGWIEPGKNVLLDGKNALWFARSREYSSDYERMERQKCVMNAMLKQLSPTTVLTKFEAIADAGKHVAATDMPASEIANMLDLGLKMQRLPMASVSFVPPLIQPANPDFDLIRQVVADEIALAEQKDEEAAKGQNPSPDASTPEPSTTPTTPKPQSNAKSLDSVCKVSK